MTKLTDIKVIYNDFKMLKNIYTALNKSSKIVFIGRDNDVRIIFSREDNFFLLFGEITFETEFTKWLKDGHKAVVMEIEKLKSITDALKKNIISLETSDVSFTFSYISKDDGETKNQVFYNSATSDTIKNESLKIDGILSQLKTKKDIPEAFISDDIFRVYLKDNELTDERVSDKLLEIPTKRILTFTKNSRNSIGFSEKMEKGERYVGIFSANEELNLNLSQLFLTI